MVNFALNKTTGIIVTFLFLLVAVGYTTNSFSQTPSGNTTTGNTTSNGNNDTTLCDPDEVLDVPSNICHKPCESGQIFNPSTGTCTPDITEPCESGQTFNPSTGTCTPDIIPELNNTQIIDDKITSRANVTINTNLDIVIKSSGNIIVLPMETGPGPIVEPSETDNGPKTEPLETGPGPETEPQ